MSKPLKKLSIDPRKLKLPKVRVNAQWTDEEFEIFQASLEADGQAAPINCIKEGDTFWISDGKHRWEEAIRTLKKKVDIVYREGRLVDAMTQNLYMNRLRGKSSVTEEIKLIKSLQEDHNLSFHQIQQKTGMSPERLEQRFQISTANPAVVEALDNEQIGIGVAYHISRLPNKEKQLDFLIAILAAIPPHKTEWVKEVVNASIEITKKQLEGINEAPPLIAVKTVGCHLCDKDYEAHNVHGHIVCETCFGVSKKYIQDLIKKQTETPSPREILARDLAGGPST